MVFCIVGLVGLSFLGIFSAKYRSLAKEAFNCVFRRITLRKCQTNFDQKMKVKISAKLAEKNPKIGGFFFKHFEAISWAMFLFLIFSLALTVNGLYNFFVYGNCNGENSNEFCIFNPAQIDFNSSIALDCGSQHCDLNGCDCNAIEGNCSEENNFIACDGNCDCIEEACG
jgi:hypothetical protein